MHLTDRLPKPNYDNHSDPGAQSFQFTPKIQKNIKSSLPKLKNLPQGLHHSIDRKRKKNTSNLGLMIEGRSKMLEQARIQDKQLSRNLEKQIKDELKKIYKVRQVGQSYDPRNAKKKSERSIILPPIKL